ncbi:low affinity immunoglobulin gamma Fc region receptor II-like isoform X2 [Dicentrarchus labrax]|uniref:low affinity immunoglobulin gamma Fc region receptor II-like isoform X2 n=1 Tax=Dicentrarchus labrax TaxID=13489 RepID=UPI0021F64522|nr:low affinity immunoglobulin gamma Fc region receptor II-like isoform X2 [Dicentrarchus labrax]
MTDLVIFRARKTHHPDNMKAPSVPLLLGLAVLPFGWTVSAVFLNVSPKQKLFFRRESVSLSCVEDGQTVDGWKVKRTAEGQTQTCDGGPQAFWSTDGSSCNVQYLSPSDSGVYWCESSAGQRSVQVNINVSDHSVILEFPKLPVIVGSNVTLRCRTRDVSTMFFFRNRTFVGTGLTGEFTIRDVQRSHEGFYSCSTGLLSRSSKGWLSVKDPEPDSSTPPPPPPPPPPPLHSLPVFRLLCHLVVVCPYFISTVLMVSIYCSKRTGHKPAVSVEMERFVEGGQGLAEEGDYVTATTEHNF